MNKKHNNLGTENLFVSKTQKTDFFGNILSEKTKETIIKNVNKKKSNDELNIKNQININIEEDINSNVNPLFFVKAKERKLVTLEKENILYLEELEKAIKNDFKNKYGTNLEKRIKSEILNKVIEVGLKEILK